MVIQKNKTRNRTSSSKPNCCQSQSGPLQAVTTEGRCSARGRPHSTSRTGTGGPVAPDPSVIGNSGRCSLGTGGGGKSTRL